MASINVFGWQFEIGKAEAEDDNLKAITPDAPDGSSVEIVGEGSYAIGDSYQGMTAAFDVNVTAENESQLIARYREVSMISEVDFAIDDIVNAFVTTEDREPIKVDLDAVEGLDKVKQKISEEFEYILDLLNFNTDAYKIIRRWYIDGRLPYQVIVSQDQYKNEGISKLVYLDPMNLRKIRQVKKTKDERTGAEVYSDALSYYVYSDSFVMDQTNKAVSLDPAGAKGIRLTDESVVYATSGLLNPTNTVVLSHLHKALRSINQMKALEDAVIIYRISRAPERRVFYIDVGGLPPAKAEEHLRRQMQQYKSKAVYDSTTGSVRGDPKVLTMMEDYWLPRRADGKATEITTLPGGENLGNIGDIEYFLNKLYKTLNIPVSRLDSTSGFTIGRVTEISRDEVKFMKFIYRLRREFSKLFLDLLQRQLALKGIMNKEEFEQIRNKIHFEFASDNIFEEAKMNEIMMGRVDLIQRMENMIGVFYSREWIKRNVLRQNDEEIKEIQDEMDNEKEEFADEYGDEEDGGQVMHYGDPRQQLGTPEPTPQPAPEQVPSQNQKEPETKKEPVQIKPKEQKKNDKAA